MMLCEVNVLHFIYTYIYIQKYIYFDLVWHKQFLYYSAFQASQSYALNLRGDRGQSCPRILSCKRHVHSRTHTHMSSCPVVVTLSPLVVVVGVNEPSRLIADSCLRLRYVCVYDTSQEELSCAEPRQKSVPKFEDAQARAFIFSIWWQTIHMNIHIHSVSVAASARAQHSTAHPIPHIHMGDSHVRKDIPRLITLARRLCWPRQRHRETASASAGNELGLAWIGFIITPSVHYGCGNRCLPHPPPTCLRSLAAV